MGNAIPTTTPGPTTASGPTTISEPTQEGQSSTTLAFRKYDYIQGSDTATANVPAITNNKNCDTLYNNKECNANSNCIYAAKSCYNLTFNNIGLINTTTINCNTNRNKDNSYTLEFQAVNIGKIYIIKKLEFTVNDNNDPSGNSILSATYIDLDMSNQKDKEKVLFIESNGVFNFTINITGGSDIPDYDFTNITLTDINNLQVTLSNTNAVNTIYNLTSLNALRNTMVKINYDSSFAQKANQLDKQNQHSLNNIANRL